MAKTKTATKTKSTKYVLSRSKLVEKLQELQGRLEEVDTSYTSPAEVGDVLSELASELGDLSYEVTDIAY